MFGSGAGGAALPGRTHVLRVGSHTLARKQVLLGAAAAAAAVGGTVCLQHQYQRIFAPPQRQQQQGQLAWKLPRPLMEVICGAVGEIVQVAVLYPMDTIKVRCQAGGLSSGQVVRDLFKSGAAPSVLRQLYSGVMSASLCSAVIGALYYASFCACKRAAHSAADAIEKRQQQQRPMAAATTAAAAAAVPHHLPHGLPVGHHHDAVMATICYDEATTAAAASTSAAAGGSAAIAASPSAASGACCAVDAADVAPVAAQEGSGASNGGLRLAANLAASVAAGLMGGLVEGPLELFKHQAQAGQISGSLFSHMAGTVQSRGLGALYVSFVPFLLKSLPFDCSELVTYSSLQDMRDRELAAPLPPPGAAAAGSATQLNAAVRAVPDHVWDCAIGATAGAAAVIISHPFDVVKTVMETGGSAAAAGTGAGAFAATARNVVAKQGPGGLWVGIVPRMAEVPSTMVYWLAVEGCRRLLEPHTAK